MSTAQSANRSKVKKVELILQQLNSLPTLPAIAARLLQVTVQSNTQADEVVQLIESDQALASKIIALTTEASKGINRKTPTSVGKAVVLLGFDAVRNAVLSIKVFETLGGSGDPETNGFNRIEFWKHSLAVACATKKIIRHIDKKADPEEAFICGLLHDMGKVALDTCLPKSFARVVQLTEASLGNIADVEQKILGMDHTAAGKRLAQKWNLPTMVIETVWLHHQHPQSLPDVVKHRSMVQAVYLADLVAREQRIGYSGNHLLPESAATVAEELGCKASVIETVARELRQEISERAGILGLEDLEPQELYHEALSGANSELGKVNARLALQNRRLEVRSKYLELLGNLGHQLQSGQSVVDVCSIIAEAWKQHSNCLHCAVYTQSDEGLVYEGSAHLAGEEKGMVFLVDQTDAMENEACTAGSRSAGGFEITLVDPRHDWFFEQVAPAFDIASTYLMPLIVGNRLVGGVLWQERDGQNQNSHQHQLKEMEAFAATAAMALQQALRQEEQNTLCEQLAQSNRLLHEARQELVQNRSLAIVGEMASGAAHEINNPLAVVVGRAQLLASSEEDPQRRQTLEAIAKEGQEITAILTELMTFAKPSAPQPQSIRLRQVVATAVNARAQQAQEEKVTIEVALEEDVPEIHVDETQISLAIEELLANAIASYQQQGGTVRISSAFDELDNEVILEICDQGCGMDSATLEKAFAPFFSGKQAGRNRGLGLSRSARHAESNGGRLRLISEPGEGTTARLTLPISQLAPTDEVAV